MSRNDFLSRFQHKMGKVGKDGQVSGGGGEAPVVRGAPHVPTKPNSGRGAVSGRRGISARGSGSGRSGYTPSSYSGESARRPNSHELRTGAGHEVAARRGGDSAVRSERGSDMSSRSRDTPSGDRPRAADLMSLLGSGHKPSLLPAPSGRPSPRVVPRNHDAPAHQSSRDEPTSARSAHTDRSDRGPSSYAAIHGTKPTGIASYGAAAEKRYEHHSRHDHGSHGPSGAADPERMYAHGGQSRIDSPPRYYEDEPPAGEYDEPSPVVHSEQVVESPPPPASGRRRGSRSSGHDRDVAGSSPSWSSAPRAGRRKPPPVPKTRSPQRAARAAGHGEPDGGGFRELSHQVIPDYARKGPDRNEERVKTDEDMLVFSKKSRHVQYKPKSLKSYQADKPKSYYQLGSLGADLNSDDLIAKRANQERVKEFSKALRSHNAHAERKRRPPPPKPAPASEPSAREKALMFAKNVPKPRVKKTEAAPDAVAFGSKVKRPHSPITSPQKGRYSSPRDAFNIGEDHTGVAALEAEHDRYAADIDAIRREFGY